MNVSIIGSGNVAHHLANNLFNSGHRIVQVFSRNLDHAHELANIVNAEATNQIASIFPDADFYLICVSDRAINEIADQWQFEPRLIAHTSGSIPMLALSKFKNHGVFYPLQTFTKERAINLSQIPICIEANHQEAKLLLMGLAKSISNNPIEMDSEQRKQCHLAAVFANNFVNHMYAVAQQILQDKNLPFELIKPLITETASKVQQLSPSESQTGPAVRNDLLVMEAHLHQLKSDKLEKLYSFVSSSIQDFLDVKTKK
ncbi:MAG: DUF2520 domain-containing protein [Salinivirgaceae bacterium]